MASTYPISPYYPGCLLKNEYNFETNRLASYKNFNNYDAHPTKLAQAGLFYTGEEDKVKCNWCSFTQQGWTKEQIPWEVHRTHSPFCPFFTHTVTDTIKPNISLPSPCSTKNDAVLSYTDFQTRRAFSGVQETGQGTGEGGSVFNVNGPNNNTVQNAAANNYNYNSPFGRTRFRFSTATVSKYPQFESERQRFRTFNGFPLTHRRLLASQLCSCGFFHTGHRDIVICFCCGVGFHNWSPGDEPKIVHARWSPTCRFLYSVVTPQFIAAVLREMEGGV